MPIAAPRTRCVSLGDGSYVEILAPQAGAKLPTVDERMRQFEHLRIIDWAVSVSGVEEAIGKLRSAGFAVGLAQPGSRVTPSGERLAWTVFRLADRSLSMAPFFIHWSPDTTHPSTTAPGGCKLADLTVRDPESARLSKALAALGVGGVTYVEGAPGIEARLICGDKTATLTTSS